MHNNNKNVILLEGTFSIIQVNLHRDVLPPLSSQGSVVICVLELKSLRLIDFQ